jgi:Holliday junction resolvase-like predicted endonuclease
MVLTFHDCKIARETGEIDAIAHKEDALHFVEVETKLFINFLKGKTLSASLILQ